MSTPPSYSNRSNGISRRALRPELSARPARQAVSITGALVVGFGLWLLAHRKPKEEPPETESSPGIVPLGSSSQ